MHQSVLLQECLSSVNEMSPPAQLYFDGTFGRGGHLSAFLAANPQLSAVAVDRDHDAIAYAQNHFRTLIENNRLQIFHGNFMDIEDLRRREIWQPNKYDFILFDLGVSSPQLDIANRGFSFLHEGPLDMRMDQSQKMSAENIINEWEDEDLYRLFKEVGEVQSPRRVVNAIVQLRKNAPIKTTKELADLIASKDGWQKKGFHPATQYFMALRIAVNSELEPLAHAIEQWVEALKDKGRILIISFHSLEDRIVKQTFLSMIDKGHVVTKKAIEASDEESKNNPRSRSAKLRVFQKDSVLFGKREKVDKYAHKKGQ